MKFTIIIVANTFPPHLVEEADPVVHVLLSLSAQQVAPALSVDLKAVPVGGVARQLLLAARHAQHLFQTNVAQSLRLLRGREGEGGEGERRGGGGCDE